MALFQLEFRLHFAHYDSPSHPYLGRGDCEKRCGTSLHNYIVISLHLNTSCLPCLSEDGWRIRHLWQICQNSSICFAFLHFVIHASKVEEIVRIAGERGILSVLDMHQDVFNRLNCFFQTGWNQVHILCDCISDECKTPNAPLIVN